MNEDERIWIKKKTKDKLYEIKKSKTFDEVINELMDNPNKLMPKKDKGKFFPEF